MNTSDAAVNGWRRGAGGVWVAMAVGLFALVGCALPEAQPDLSRFYVLTATTGGEGGAMTAGEARAAVRVWVKPVVVPEFLRGKIMQVRVTENEVRFVDTARWAEPLEAGLTRVVRENLAQGKGGVEVIGRVGERHDYEVIVHLRRCEGVLASGQARIAARVEIFTTGADPKQVAEDEFRTEVDGWDGLDYGQLAAKLSEGAAGLSARIAEMLAAQGS